MTNNSARRLKLLVGCLIAAVLSGAMPHAQRPAGVTADDLLAGLKDPSRWLQFSGDYSGRRHSPLTQITPENVKHLAPQWTFQTDLPGKFETTSLVLDGIVYATGANNLAWALDAKTGRPIWRYRRELPDVVMCCGRVNRGFGILGDLLYMGTLDAHLIALDRRTGSVVWDAVLEDPKNAYSSTSAPLVVKDKVIIGMGGGEYGVRGFIDAYDASTGKRAWRFYTIPAPGEPGSESWPSDNDSWKNGGGATWMTGSYDPEQNLVVWGTGNAGPQMYGDERRGDNLYTASFVALDADTGKLRWHYQFTPHDVWDYDATHVPVLADLVVGGQPRKTVLNANRNGFFYVLDRQTGKMILAKPFAKATWASDIDRDGRPITLPNTNPNEKGATVCPANAGATNFMTPSFDPKLGLYFVTFREGCMTFYAWKTDYVPGESFRGGAGVAQPTAATAACGRSTPRPERCAGNTSIRRRRPPASPPPRRVWSSRAMRKATSSPSTHAPARTSGTTRRGRRFFASANTFMLEGRQYVLMPSGTNLTAFALPDSALR